MPGPRGRATSARAIPPCARSATGPAALHHADLLLVGDLSRIGRSAVRGGQTPTRRVVCLLTLNLSLRDAHPIRHHRDRNLYEIWSRKRETSRPRPPARPGSRCQPPRAPARPRRSASQSATRWRSRPRPGAHLDTAVEHELGVEDTVAQLGDPHLLQAATEGTSRSGSRIRSCVSGRAGTTPCWAKAMAVASTAPIQIGSAGVPRPPLAAARSAGWRASRPGHRRRRACSRSPTYTAIRPISVHRREARGLGRAPHEDERTGQPTHGRYRASARLGIALKGAEVSRPARRARPRGPPPPSRRAGGGPSILQFRHLGDGSRDDECIPVEVPATGLGEPTRPNSSSLLNDSASIPAASMSSARTGVTRFPTSERLC